jgi:hypothetical protein
VYRDSLWEDRTLRYDVLGEFTRLAAEGKCGDRVMKATLIVIESDSDHAQAKALVSTRRVTLPFCSHVADAKVVCFMPIPVL